MLVLRTEVLMLRRQWVLAVVDLATPMSDGVAIARCHLYFGLNALLI
jgi:hypothetical protein